MHCLSRISLTNSPNTKSKNIYCLQMWGRCEMEIKTLLQVNANFCKSLIGANGCSSVALTDATLITTCRNSSSQDIIFLVSNLRNSLTNLVLRVLKANQHLQVLIICNNFSYILIQNVAKWANTMLNHSFPLAGLIIMFNTQKTQHK